MRFNRLQLISSPIRRRGSVLSTSGMMGLTLALACFALSQPFLSGSAAAFDESGQAWSGGFVSRLEALALLQTLNADLLSHDSATLTLERWCGAHHLASPAKIVAERVRGADKLPDASQRELLAVGPTEIIRYRRVNLRCGSRLLSEADNWYVPSRLTPTMNAALEGSDVPFGRAVQDLHFRRRTISAELLWSPLPDAWESGAEVPALGAEATLKIPHEVLRHRAILTLPDGTPFSEVVETYTEEVLAFPHLHFDSQKGMRAN